MEEMIYTYRLKYLPLSLYNKAWRWQYKVRHTFARKINNCIAGMKRQSTKPKLYNDDTSRHYSMGKGDRGATYTFSKRSALSVRELL